MEIYSLLVFAGLFSLGVQQSTHARSDLALTMDDTVFNIRNLIASTSSIPDEPSEVDICRSSLTNFTSDLIEKEQYALRVLDCDGKLESGVLLGRAEWRGEYFECQRIINDHFSGRWCAVEIGEQLTQYVNVKRGLSVGICFPEKCTEAALNAALDVVSNRTGIELRAKCPIQPTHWSAEDVLSIVVVALLGGLCILGTIFHFFAERTRNQENKMSINDEASVGGTTSSDSIRVQSWLDWSVLRSFSVAANSSKLLKQSDDPDHIHAINGIRFLDVSLVILQHIFFIGFTIGDNPVTLMHWLRRNVTAIVVFTGSCSVDTFFLMAAILVSYHGLKEMSRKDGNIPILKMYLLRYLRLTPSYAVVILITVGFYSKLTSGPRWPDFISSLQIVCSNTWWTELLYFNNVYPYDSMNQCFSIGWYLACDFQYYVISPFFIILLYKRRKWGITALITATILSVLTVAVMANVYDWQPDIVTGSEYSRNVDDAVNRRNGTFHFEGEIPLRRAINVTDDFYFRPWTHASVYFIGMLIGYYLYESKRSLRIHWTSQTLAWAASITTCCVVVYSIFPHVAGGYKCSVIERTLYISLFQPAWAISVGWIIVACATGNAGVINNILSSKFMVPLGRLTYGIYLTHCMIIMAYFGSLEENPTFSPNFFIMLFFALVVLSTTASLILWYLIEAPAANLLRIAIPRPRNTNNSVASI